MEYERAEYRCRDCNRNKPIAAFAVRPDGTKRRTCRKCAIPHWRRYSDDLMDERANRLDEQIDEETRYGGSVFRDRVIGKDGQS